MKLKINPRNKILIFAFAIYVFITFVMIFRHEPWRDEGQAWLIVRDSPDIWSVFRLMGYEGTPALWHIIIFPLTKLGLPIISMAILHSILSIAAVGILMRFSPFKTWQKVLFVFGYLIIYEFNIIARSYVLMVLLMFALASVYKVRHEKRMGIVYVILLVLLMNSTVFGVVAGVIIGGIYFYEKLRVNGLNGVKKLSFVIPLVLFVFVGILIPYIVLRKPADIGVHGATYLSISFERLQAICVYLARGFGAYSVQILPGQKFIGLIAYLVSLWTFRKNVKYLFLYGSLSLAFLAIFYLESVGFAFRHNGLVYLLYFFVLWLFEDDLTVASSRSRIDRIVLNIFLAVILSAQVMCAFVSLRRDYAENFSSGKMVAEYINEQGLNTDNYAFAGYRNYTMSAILPYLPGRKVYSPESDREMTYMIWDKISAENSKMSTSAIIKLLNTYNTKMVLEGKTLLLVSSVDFASDAEFGVQYELIKKFTGAINSDEDFYIWKYR
jgi:hypothetical protein